MSQLSKSTYKTLYGSTGSVFPDNTTEEISEGDMRQFGEDQADSFMSINDNFINGDPTFSSYSTTKAPSQKDTKDYVDSQVNANLSGLAWKQPVKAATTANITLSGTQTIDGIALIAADRCLVKNQSTGSQNGIYVVAAGSWTRATDNDSTADMQNAVVSVDQGTANADTSWRQSADSVTVGSTSVTWVSFGAAGLTGSLTADRIPFASGTTTVTDSNDFKWLGTYVQIGTTRYSSATIIPFEQFAIVPTTVAGTAGYNMEISSGAVSSGSGDSGDLYLTGGNNTGSGAPGSVIILPGNSGVNSSCLIGTTTGTRFMEVAGAVAIKAGSSTGQIARVGGTIKTDTTQTGNVGSGEDTLQTYSVPANTLATNGDTLSGTVSGTFAATGNNKVIRIRFGSALIFESPAFSDSGGADWVVRFEIIRTGSATQKCHATIVSDAFSYSDYSTAAETLSGAITLLVTGEATSNNDTVKETFKLMWEPSE